MAAKKRKKKGFTIRFELGIGGVLGLGVVCFCVFLWMFLLGVWSGQTVLLPSSPGKGPEMLSRMASNLWQQGKSSLKEGLESGREAVEELKLGKNDQAAEDAGAADESGASYFSLQVGSFRDKKEAHRAVLGWQARGQDAFFLPPEGDSNAYRVFVGKFEKLAKANEIAAGLESDENVRAYITLLSEEQLHKK
ncbi:MAG: SPOR domain-containing protein [Desulfobulbaceae bacterium]|nr:SPOR domain-containing protein [Desulfobulbaceae bacterium]